MSTVVLERPATPAAKDRLAMVDCDIHPTTRTAADLNPFLSRRWQEHRATIGGRSRQALLGTTQYPRLSPGTGMRRDAWPPGGGPPGCDLAFMREQLLDPLGVAVGMMLPLMGRCSDERNLDYAAALSTAVNDWQLALWCEPEPRLRASVQIAIEHQEAAIAEIERRAGDRRFSQVLMTPRGLEPLGRRRYWPVLEAAAANGFPVALHLGGNSGHASTAGGWPSYYHEEHHSYVQGMESLLTSLVVEGVFARIPDLKVVLIEGGFSWMLPLCWRLDKHWARLRDEVPHLTRPPSQYIRENVWVTTQPMEDPERPQDLVPLFEATGWDRVMFATDYPHWDQDDPRYAIKFPISEAQRRKIFRENAVALYGLD